MRWLRDNIGHGSWLALIALAINVMLSFGHIHAIGGHRSERDLIVVAVASPDGHQTPDRSDNGKADHLCPICTAAAAIGTALVPTSPALPAEFADTAIDHAVENPVAISHTRRAAFQSCGPPIS